MLSKQEMLIYLHAMSEVFNEFTTTNKTFKQCASEYNVENGIGKMFSISVVQTVLNNFCEQKDEHWDNTNNDDYTLDNLSAYRFSNIQILNGINYSSKRIVKEIRDGIEHLSYTINDDLKYIIVDNKRTGFNAKVNIGFFFGSFFAYFDARNFSTYLLDDRNIVYRKGFNKNINRLKIYRLLPKFKHTIRNSEYNSGKGIREITRACLNQNDYERDERPLDENQISLLKEYFKSHEFNKRNLAIALSQIALDDSGFSNQVNYFVIFFLQSFGEILVTSDFTFEEIISNEILKNNIMNKFLTEEEYINIFELLCNYFKIQFVKYYYQNKPNNDDEEKHIRNCLCHARYTLTSSDTIIFNDHRNGISNEKDSTYYAVYNLNELYNKVKKECFETRNTYYFK